MLSYVRGVGSSLQLLHIGTLLEEVALSYDLEYCISGRKKKSVQALIHGEGGWGILSH